MAKWLLQTQAIAELHNRRDNLLRISRVADTMDSTTVGELYRPIPPPIPSKSHEALASDTADNADQIIEPATFDPKYLESNL
jgi:hypothetical protein